MSQAETLWGLGTLNPMQRSLMLPFGNERRCERTAQIICRRIGRWLVTCIDVWPTRKKKRAVYSSESGCKARTTSISAYGKKGGTMPGKILIISPTSKFAQKGEKVTRVSLDPRGDHGLASRGFGAESTNTRGLARPKVGVQSDEREYAHGRRFRKT